MLSDAFSQTMYCKAVWVKDGRETEGTLPLSWVDLEKGLVMWPKHGATKAYRMKEEPQEEWLAFKLVEIKMNSGMFWFFYSYIFIIQDKLLKWIWNLRFFRETWVWTIQSDQPCRGGWGAEGQKRKEEALKKKICRLCSIRYDFHATTQCTWNVYFWRLGPN